MDDFSDTSPELRALIVQRLEHVGGLMRGPVNAPVPAWSVGEALPLVQWRMNPSAAPGLWQLLVPTGSMQHQVFQDNRAAGFVRTHEGPEGWIVGPYIPTEKAPLIQAALEVLDGYGAGSGTVYLFDDDAHELGALVSVEEDGESLGTVPFHLPQGGAGLKTLGLHSFDDILMALLAAEDQGVVGSGQQR
jgi:hypothetical protein